MLVRFNVLSAGAVFLNASVVLESRYRPASPGDRFTKPKQHLEEVTEYFHSIGGVPRWLQDGLDFSQAQV